MAEEVGAAFVSLIPSARGFSRSARQAIAQELRGESLSLPVQPEIDQAAVTRMLSRQMRITADVDVDRGQVQAALMGATRRDRVTVDTTVSATQLGRETRAAIAATEATRPTVEVGLDVDKRPGWLGRLFGRTTVDQDGRALGTQLGMAAMTGLGDSARDGVGSALSGLAGNPVVGTIGGALGVALGVVTAPALFATISAATAAATLAGTGLGVIFAGAFILASNPIIQKAWTGFTGRVGKVLQNAAKPLIQPFVQSLDILGDAFEDIGPDLRTMFAAIAPYVPKLAEGVAGFIKAFTPGLVDAVVASGPVLEQIAWALPDLGAGISSFLSAMADVAPQAALFMGMMIRGLGDIIQLIALFVKGGARLFGYLAAEMSRTWDILKIGLILLDALGAALLGRFEYAEDRASQAIGQIIRMLKRLWDAASSAVNGLVRLMSGMPGRIRSAVGSLGGLLFRAGQNVVNGLIDGIWSRFGALANAASSMAGTIRAYLPFSPAKEGPLSGSGNPYISGQTIGSMLAGGMQSRIPVVASAGASLAGAVGLGARTTSAGASVAGRLVAEWVGGDGDPIVRALREHIRIYYGGSPETAMAS